MSHQTFTSLERLHLDIARTTHDEKEEENPTLERTAKV